MLNIIVILITLLSMSEPVIEEVEETYFINTVWHKNVDKNNFYSKISNLFGSQQYGTITLYTEYGNFNGFAVKMTNLVSEEALIRQLEMMSDDVALFHISDSSQLQNPSLKSPYDYDSPECLVTRKLALKNKDEVNEFNERITFIGMRRGYQTSFRYSKENEELIFYFAFDCASKDLIVDEILTAYRNK